MENTQEIHETLKSEQMESGKWYLVVDNNSNKFMGKKKSVLVNE